jgi:uncharacterized protein YjbJ (UPF0337 family)
LRNHKGERYGQGSCRGIGKTDQGKVVGDAKLESDGKADKAEGKVQNAVGGLKDAVRDTVKKS